MRGSTQRAAAAERFARYCELRDQGAEPAAAGAEVGVGERTQENYERGYREHRGLPRRAPGWGKSYAGGWGS